MEPRENVELTHPQPERSRVPESFVEKHQELFDMLGKFGLFFAATLPTAYVCVSGTLRQAQEKNCQVLARGEALGGPLSVDVFAGKKNIDDLQAACEAEFNVMGDEDCFITALMSTTRDGMPEGIREQLLHLGETKRREAQQSCEANGTLAKAPIGRK